MEHSIILEKIFEEYFAHLTLFEPQRTNPLRHWSTIDMILHPNISLRAGDFDYYGNEANQIHMCL